MTGCSTDDAVAPPPATTTVTVTTEASTTPLPTTSTTTDALPPPPPGEPAPEPVTFSCGDLPMYQSGTAIYSDGSIGYEATCDTSAAPEPPTLWYCDYPGVAVYTDGSSSSTDPACTQPATGTSEAETGGDATSYPYNADEDRNGDGVVQGYERCGLACGEAPTSGDIQTQYGCEQGYITGPQCN
ncbi:hypothetical protein [Rhodococcus aetherivorans]